MLVLNIFLQGPWKNEGSQISDPLMQDLFEKLPGVVLKDKADSTTTKYAQGFQRWAIWAKARDQPVPVMPASPLHVALYLLSLMQTSDTPSPITTAFYSIAWAHRVSSLTPPTDHPLPKSVLEAAKRTLVKTHKGKEPLSLETIQKLCQRFPLESSSLFDIRTLTIIVLGFAGFLRFNEISNLKCSDILIYDTHTAIFVEKSKTDKYREGSWVLISRTNNSTCPVRILEKYLDMCAFQQDANQFVFCSLSKTKSGYIVRKDGKPISYSRLRELFISAIKEVVPNVEAFGLHSLRSGGATQAARSGIPDRLIKKHGRWASETAKDLYIREALQDKLRLSLSLGL